MEKFQIVSESWMNSCVPSYFSGSLYAISLWFDPEINSFCVCDANENTLFTFDANNQKLVMENEEAFVDVCKNQINRCITLKKSFEIVCQFSPDNKPLQNVLNALVTKGEVNQYSIMNVFRYFDDLEALEKLGDACVSLLSDENLTLNLDGKKRNHVVELPKRVLDEIVELYPGGNEQRRVIACFRQMMREDANELLAITEYLRSMQVINKKIPSSCRYSYNSVCTAGDDIFLLESMANVRQKNEEINLRKLLKYLLGQHMSQLFVETYSSRNNSNGIRFLTTYPSTIARLYIDYLEMGATDYFPQDLRRAHNVLAIENTQNASVEDILAFEEYGKQLSQVCDADIGDYMFRVPTNHQEFLKHAKVFKNCLPSCTKAFAHGLCNIVFIFPKESDVPLYAIELDNNFDVVQAKTYHDMEIFDENVIGIIHSYVTKLRKETNA